MQQRILPQSAIDAFDTPEGVVEQLQHFKSLLGFNRGSEFSLLDVGGGTRFFAKAVQAEFPLADVTILDLDMQSVIKGTKLGLYAIHGSITDPPESILARKFDVISFNLILHHIIGDNELATFELQRFALGQACRLLTNQGQVFIHEICYEGRFSPDLSALLIWQMTSSSRFSKVLRLVGKMTPALKSNTVGIGVRFRPVCGWMAIANQLGLRLINTCQGEPEGHSWIRRVLLFIREVRRQSLVVGPGKTTKVSSSPEY